MGLLTAGYWHSTYWAKDYWHDDYWQDYGVVESQAVFSIITVKSYSSAEISAIKFIAAGIAAKKHIAAVILVKEEQ